MLAWLWAWIGSTHRDTVSSVYSTRQRYPAKQCLSICHETAEYHLTSNAASVSFVSPHTRIRCESACTDRKPLKPLVLTTLPCDLHLRARRRTCGASSCVRQQHPAH